MVEVRSSPTSRTIPFLIAARHCERSVAIRFRVWVATAVLLLAIVSTATAKYSGGSGTAQDPYQIATAADLIGLGATPADYDKHFVLTADLDLDPNLPGRKVFDKAVIAPETNDVTEWFDGTPFTGVFDGNGHMISHLTITGGGYLGLFGKLGRPASVSNLGLEVVEVSATGTHVGGLVGDNQYGSIVASYSSGSVTGTGSGVGGLVGSNSRGRITASSSGGAVSGTQAVGGLVGSNTLSGSVAGSYSTAVVSGTSSVGGLVGSNGGSIISSHSSGSVSGTEHVGGLVGGNSGRITTSYSTSSVNGGSSVGGLVGENWEGSVAASYSNGSVSGTEYVGGLVGGNNRYSGIATSYSNGSVRGNRYVGGLVGGNNCRIISSYSSGAVSGKESVGGLVGSGVSPPYVIACVWDMETSGLSVCANGVGLTTVEMMDPNMLGLNGFANDPNWVLDAGRDYPRLAWEGTPGQIISEPGVDWLAGNGTEEEPYRIDTAEQLIFLRRASALWNGHFVLGADIDLDPVLPGRSVFGQAVIPNFTGVFDGGSHVISNLTIEGGGYLGLFGCLMSKAEVRNVGVVDVNITASGYCVGGLAGATIIWSDTRGPILTNCYCSGSISGSGKYVGGLVGGNGFWWDTRGAVLANCHSSALVSGTDDVGGLVGYNSQADIDMCYSSGSVSATGTHVGGLVGDNWYGSIAASYSTGPVSGDWGVGGLVGANSSGSIAMSYSSGSVSGGSNVGGLVGSNGGTVTRCYTTGAVSGKDHVGGLVPWNYGGRVTDCFWDTQTSRQTTSAGGIGKTTAEMQKAETFLNAGWDFVGETANGTADLWWINEGKDYPRLWWELTEKKSAATEGE